MRKYLFTRARECGMEKGQPRILDYVYVNDGCIQREIRDEFSMDAASISNLLRILEKDGILRRKRNPLSSREVNVYITDKGWEIQKRLEVVYDELEQITFQGFSPEEKEQCIHYLSRLTKNMMSYRKDEFQ
jgi:DNA-binding MarR family transcriptional regulator